MVRCSPTLPLCRVAVASTASYFASGVIVGLTYRSDAHFTESEFAFANLPKRELSESVHWPLHFEPLRGIQRLGAILLLRCGPTHSEIAVSIHVRECRGVCFSRDHRRRMRPPSDQ